ncbi:MAG: flavin reductase family protein [Anaerolineae bacterium]
MAKIELSPERALRLLVPGPVVLLTAQFRGQPNVMPAAWVMPASYRPPMVSMAVYTETFTRYLLARSQEFIINIPGRPLAEAVWGCGQVSGKDVDKFARFGLTPVEGKRVTAPWVDECLAHIECGVVESFEAGDHALILGQVIGVWAEEQAFETSWKLEEEEMAPLHHLGGRTFAILGEPFTVLDQAP